MWSSLAWRAVDDARLEALGWHELVGATKEELSDYDAAHHRASVAFTAACAERDAAEEEFFASLPRNGSGSSTS
jgi:hypothetical protein